MNIVWPLFADVADFLIIIGAAVFVALVWLFLFRSRLMRRHKHHHHHRRSQRKLNPTLAQTGGLPPIRKEDKPPQL
jgi:type VI protein secretion system component VasK